ncbi:hypothetical protein HMPREF9074_08020 [Capnocytophaga sp. oral taxon 329 str. F0087]|nr:hypothetical protein HMPREF9074_08020 [Capnocytophaga sp. oral taxon 329 str. F0087]
MTSYSLSWFFDNAKVYIYILISKLLMKYFIIKRAKRLKCFALFIP